MRLVHEPDVVATVDALDEPELPQRMVAIEDLLHEPLGERDQLAARSRRGEPGEVHVARDVELRVVDPDRATQAERDVLDAAAEARDERQPGPDEVPHVVEPESPVGPVERLALEHRDRAHVHRRLGPLEVQEGLVERAEPVVTREAGTSHARIVRPADSGFSWPARPIPPPATVCCLIMR